MIRIYIYLSASEVVFHEEALYQVYVPLPLRTFNLSFKITVYLQVEYLKSVRLRNKVTIEH